LLAVGLTDELWSGVAVVAAPEVERHHAVDHSGYALTVFTLPILLSAVLEALVALSSHKLPRRRVLGAALCVLAVSLLICATAATPWALAAGLSVAGAASGAACAAAEAELVTQNPGALDRVMARWMVFGGIGDVLAPVLVALSLALGGSYRVGFAIVLIWVGLQGLNYLRTPARPAATEEVEEEETVPLRVALALSLRNTRLWLWLLGTALCTLLDELVAALSALRMRNDLGASDAQAALALTAFSGGVVLGAFLTERFVERLGYRRILIGSTLVCLLALTSTLLAPSVVWMTISLFALGLSAAAQYPLLLARAYESAPGRAAIVGAMTEAFVVMDLALPLLIGALADVQGLQVALACLGLQPVGVLVLVLCMKPLGAASRQ
jgi:MFS family permease